MSYRHIRNTGIGAVNVPYCGQRIKFDKDGNYPTNTKEFLQQQNEQLKKRNTFLEHIYIRACFDEKEQLFNMSDYVYC